MLTNLLDIELKRSKQKSFRQPLTRVIEDLFSQRLDNHEDDLTRLDALRDSAINSPANLEGLERLKRYNAQLLVLLSRLPNDLGIEFEWQSISNPAILEGRDDLAFERCNILVNIALTHAALGVKENRSTADGLKKAHQQFQVSAGCIEVLQQYLETVQFEKPDDLQPALLECIRNAMLGQAQECIWQRAVLDQMKDKLIAQLSQQVSLFYDKALKFMESSTAMSTTWVHHFTLKKYHFAAAAQVRMSAFAVSNGKYGEEVARLRLASDLCRRAQQHVSFVGKLVAQDLKGLTDHVTNNAQRAERDNDMIYVMPVPGADKLPNISPQIMVKATAVAELNDVDRDLQDQLAFTDLMPFVIRNIIQIFEQRKNEIVSKDIINKFHTLDLEMQALLHELGLPGSLTVLEQPLGIPASLKKQSEDVRREGGLKYVERLVGEVSALATANAELVDQIVDLMDADEMESPQTHSETSPIAGYRHQIDQYHAFLNQAKDSDNLVKLKVEKWRPLIQILAAGESRLATAIPDAQRTTLSRETEQTSRKVRNILNRWNLLSRERQVRIDTLREFAESDDMTADLVEYANTLQQQQSSKPLEAHQFEEILSARLASYQAKTQIVSDSADTQQELMKDIQSANDAFVHSKSRSNKDDTTTEVSKREASLQEFDTAYHKYREIVHNLEEGSKFYTDFHQALCRVNDEVSLALTRLKDDRPCHHRHHDHLEVNENLAFATDRLTLNDSRSTILNVGRHPTPGTWTPAQGISFGKKNGTESKSTLPTTTSPTRDQVKHYEGTEAVPSTRAAKQSNVFDPSVHSIRFSSS